MSEKDILIAICCGENAKTLSEIAEMVSFPFSEVVALVDGLVGKGILQPVESLHLSDVGTIVYTFAQTDAAQIRYAELQKPCAWNPSCMNDAEYMFNPIDKQVFHSSFCSEHRKSI